MHKDVAEKLNRIAEICESYEVERLEVFGSAARGSDFSNSSDVDLLYVFKPNTQTFLSRYFGLKRDLSSALGRSVDLINTNAIKNPYVLERANTERELIYAS
ncbi:MAG: nucleotidyltransferase domain-containing protein [Gammaproteobacteria bacterium]|nr:nucleotidyltransferase domain-containing protein [Gammaproteobacteria bacterium]